MGEQGAGAQRPPAGATRMIALLAGMTALGSLSIHMIVPALPMIGQTLHASQAQTQLTIGLYLVAIGIGQLIWGPVADRHGRRPALIASLLLFSTGSALCLVAPSLSVLLAGRMVQALGSSGTLVASRAVVADISGPDRAVSGLATLSTVTLVSPAIAPGIGGLLVETANWRSLFAVLLVLGCSLLAGAAWRFRETARPVAPAGSATAALRYRRLLRTPRFIAVALGASCWTALMYHFLSASPFLLRDSYGLSPGESGLVYLGVSSCMIAGTIAVRLLAGRDAAALLRIAVLCMGGAIALLLLAASGFLPGLAGLMLPMAGCAFASGICVPAALALAQQSAPGAVATASSLFGAMQMLVAAGVASSLSSLFDKGAALPLSLAGLGAIGSLCFRPALRSRTRRGLSQDAAGQA